MQTDQCAIIWSRARIIHHSRSDHASTRCGGVIDRARRLGSEARTRWSSSSPGRPRRSVGTPRCLATNETDAGLQFTAVKAGAWEALTATTAIGAWAPSPPAGGALTLAASVPGPKI